MPNPNMEFLPEMVALWADENNTPAEPWNKPVKAHPIVVKAGVKGFWPVNPRLDVDHFNSHAGANGSPATKAQIAAMMYGSMFGFHCPIANPNSFNKDGVLRGSNIDNVTEAQKDVVKFLGLDRHG